MSDIEAIEVLTQAKERLFEYGWAVGATCVRPETMCLEEAIAGKGNYVATLALHGGAEAHLRAAGYVKAAVGLPDYCALYGWNDVQTSAGPVFDAIDRAIEIAKEAVV